MEYSEQLKNQLWLEKRSQILKRDNFRCVICGEEKRLQIHHKRYVYGRFAWEYSNDDLVTLCSNCHNKIHNDPNFVFNESERNRGRREKITFIPVFYRYLLKNKLDFSPCERILYSLYIESAILSDVDGFNMNTKKLDIDYWQNKLSKNPYIPMGKISINGACKLLKISNQSILNCKNRLRKKNIIQNNLIKVPLELLSKGYFEINTQIPLKGELLVFYHYLKDKAKRYGGCIDTFKYKLAEETGTTIIAIKQSLNKLYKRGYIKRLENGKLQVLI